MYICIKSNYEKGLRTTEKGHEKGPEKSAADLRPTVFIFNKMLSEHIMNVGFPVYSSRFL